jgi:hypothetical protein
MPAWRDHASQPRQNAATSGGSATLTGQKIGLDPHDRPSRPRAGNEIRHGLWRAHDVMQHRTGRHQVEVGWLDGPVADIYSAEFEVRRVRLHQRQVEIDSDHTAAAADAQEARTRWSRCHS